MAFFALLWKARTIENYRINYEKEKINSMLVGQTQLEQTLSQRWRHYRVDTKKRISRVFQKWYPDGSAVSNFFLYLITDQTFPNFLLKSVMGFVGGIILTYLCFMFFVFQLAISLIHATIMSSIIGVLLTLGLAFSYRIRCLVFLLIPQFFSRVGRYTLTCYALVLILTGPATNTLKNSEVLSESMACSQEQIKTSVHQLNDLIKNPVNAIKDSIKLMVDQLQVITAKVKETAIRIDRLVLSVATAIQSSYSWLQSVIDMCNAKLGTPYDRCCNVIQNGMARCQKSFNPEVAIFCNVASVANMACYSLKPFKAFCYATDIMDEAILASVKKKLRNFSEHLREMFYVDVHVHHSYIYSSNTSRSASQVAAGIVTEIRNRADPLLTWLSWSSCVTSLFLLLIIFRAKYYQHMYETRSRFDNCYVTKELQELDLKRQQQGRETVLPLNRRERAKYITTSSFRLVASEKVYLNRSAVFMAITTFKLLIHMVADYSLYWVLMTIRYHGRYQSELMPGLPHSGAHVHGTGFVARLFKSLVEILEIPLSFPAPSSIACLPDPYSPDLRRYTQIGVLIFLLWFFALFEPYGLRLRHLIMGHYRPERAKARATWLFNHILRTRVSFMKFARRKLHREYKYSSEASLTFRQWITDLIPFQCLRSLVGLGPKPEHCLLCGITSCSSDPDSQLTKCPTRGCPGVFCISCFMDIGELCTICLSPADYGDLSDVSLEKGSSDDSDSDAGLDEERMDEHAALLSNIESGHIVSTSRCEDRRWDIFSRTIGPNGPLDAIALLRTRRLLTTLFKKRLKTIQSSMKKHYRSKKYTLDWIAKLTPENMFKDFSKDDIQNSYSNLIDDYKFKEVIIRTKSIGVNTDRNRGVLLNMLVNSFSRRNSKQPDLKRYKKLPTFFTEVKFKEQRNIKLIHQTEKQTVIETSKRTLFSTKTILAHNLTICQRNLKTVVRSKRDDGTKDKIKGYNELKGVMKAIRYFLNNKQINISKQNNGNTSNHSRIANKREINKSKKKCSKTNKQKRPRRQKEGIKIIRKNSRHRMNEFQSFFSNHWNNFKCSIMPCTAQNRSEIPIPKIKRNHKRRKKRKLGVDLNDDLDDCFVKKDMKQTRNVRISAFLAELEWTKKEYKKKKDCVGGKDSFPPKVIAPAPNTTTKIVNMVQLKNLPFQWREAPKYGYCRCGDEKCYCGKKPSSISKLVSSISKHKLYPREALQRFRNRITTAITPSSSLVNRMLSTIKTAGVDRPFSRNSSICIAKRPSIYRPFNEEFGQNIDCASIKSEQSDILDTDILFKNLRYDDYKQDTSNSNDEINMMVPSLHLQDSDIIVSRSSKEGKPRVTKGCKCDMFDDIQRKWEHVKKSKMIKMKKFCSTLFGPSCTKKTCPHRVIPRELKIKNSPRKVKKPPKEKKKQSSKVTGGCQTHNLKEIQTQVSNTMVRDKYCAKEKAKLDKCIRKRSPQTVQDNKDNKGNNTENCMPPQQQTYGIQTDNWKVVGTQSSRAGGVQEDQLVSKSCSALCEEPECIKAQQDAITSAVPEDITNLKTDNLINTFTQFSLQDVKKNAETKSCEVQQEERLTKQAGTISLKPEVAKPEVATPETLTLEVSKPSTITLAATLKKNQNGGGFLRMPLTMQASVDNCSNPFKNSGCQPDCYNYNRFSQYEEQEEPKARTADCMPDGFIRCMCEDSFRGNPHATCTCATQHMNCGIKLTTVRPAHTMDPFKADETGIPLSPGVNKKTQFRHKQKVVNREVSCIRNYRKDVKTSVSLVQSNESDVLLNLDYGMNVAGALHGESSDTITERSNSTISLRSDGSKTDTTICSHATCNYDDANRQRKFRVKVVTKTNQATLTDKTRVCDTGTITSDWWSPIVERKGHETILLEKKKGFNTIERHKKEWRELKEIRKGRIVSFKSRTQIIPTALLSARDVLSPSRYLLESQRYYNELFAGNYRPRPQAAYVTQMPKYHEKEKTRSPVGSRRNHLHRKTKRLDECYSPIRQMSPRKRKTDQSTKTSDSPRRKPHRHDRQSNNRHYAKVGSPKKRA